MASDRAALANLATAKRLVADAAKILTEHGETDEASMRTVAAMDAIDRARREVELRQRAGLEAKANGRD